MEAYLLGIKAVFVNKADPHMEHTYVFIQKLFKNLGSIVNPEYNYFKQADVIHPNHYIVQELVGHPW